MAKRRRLTPASPSFLGNEARPEPRPAAGSAPSRPPIAQVAGETSAAAALGELSEIVTRARAEGRLIQPLALAEIDAAHLVRDRLETEEEDLQSLMASLRSRGQQTPVEVVDRGEDRTPRYGLISGWRRLAALSRLLDEDPKFGRVLALVRTPGTASDAYVAMVEENEIRVSLSFYERARIVVKALEQGVYDDARTALQTLFANVPRAKRSKIKSFMTVVEALDGTLLYPTAIGERLGLALARALEDNAALGESLRNSLATEPPPTPEAEQARLDQALQRAQDRTVDRTEDRGREPAAASPPVSPAQMAPPSVSADPEPPVPQVRPTQETAPAPPRGKGTQPPPPAAAETQTAPGIQSRYDPETGSIVLTGPAVTPALCEALDRWLKERASSGV